MYKAQKVITRILQVSHEVQLVCIKIISRMKLSWMRAYQTRNSSSSNLKKYPIVRDASCSIIIREERMCPIRWQVIIDNAFMLPTKEQLTIIDIKKMSLSPLTAWKTIVTTLKSLLKWKTNAWRIKVKNSNSIAQVKDFFSSKELSKYRNQTNSITTVAIFDEIAVIGHNCRDMYLSEMSTDFSNIHFLKKNLTFDETCLEKLLITIFIYRT